ncbi:hypothetical protein [Streptomyces sp. KL116D]|uniref:GntT/GntP/DsdX family permease n=1 Tax=Streptomyces sp. KL116D TaxID=3045152 RepID=UPI0035565E60
MGVLIALGAILGKLLADSGGADQIVDTTLARAGSPAAGTTPWAMVLDRLDHRTAAVLRGGRGIVPLIPVVLMVAKRGNHRRCASASRRFAGIRPSAHGPIPPHPARSSRSTRPRPTSASRSRSARPGRHPDGDHRRSGVLEVTPPSGWTSRPPRR